MAVNNDSIREHLIFAGVPAEHVSAMEAKGIGLQTILQWLLIYGLPLLLQLLGLKPAPLPPAPPLPITPAPVP